MRPRFAFTLVELLIVIAIVGILVAILLPAVQASREAARKTECKSHLKQISTAFLSHESAQGFFPSSGWGYKWVGDRDAGYGEEQPGGWAYNILAYMEYGSLHDAALDRQDLVRLYEEFDTDESGEVRSSLPLVATPVPLFNCPSRRAARLYPVDQYQNPLAYNAPDCSFATRCQVARGDYRVNSGNLSPGDQEGPPFSSGTLAFSWQFQSRNQSGISFQRSSIRVGEITDGTSKTAMVGEKYLDPEHYDDGVDKADNQCVFSGHDSDNNGYTASRSPNGDGARLPKQDRPGESHGHHFGSAHSAGLHMAYCDGSVHFIRYDVDERIWVNLGGRSDEPSL
jgi:prepilin-type N-terminal cleavage/methylation domain-containing protein